MKSRECVGRNPLILSVYFHVFCLRMSFVSIRLVVMTQNVRKGRKTREEDKVQQAYKKKEKISQEHSLTLLCIRTHWTVSLWSVQIAQPTTAGLLIY